MLMLVLCFPMTGGRTRSETTESVTSSHVPQIGSTVSTSGRNHGTWRVDNIGQTVSDGLMENRIYVYLEAAD